MKSLAIAAALFVFCAAPPALAHGPSRQKVIEAIEIDRPPEKVWDVIQHFDSLAKWHPAVESSVADKGDEVGSTRTVVLKGLESRSFVETLDKYDAAGHSYKYYIEKVDPKILPVNDYASTIKVTGNGKGGSIVLWQGAFYRGYMLNDPPPELNDASSVGAIVKVYRAGLENLKNIAESAP